MVTLNRPLHTIRLSCKEVLSLSKLPYWNKSHSFIHSFIHIPPTHLHFFVWGLLISFTRHYYQWWCSNDAVVQYKNITHLFGPAKKYTWLGIFLVTLFLWLLKSLLLCLSFSTSRKLLPKQKKVLRNVWPSTRNYL